MEQELLILGLLKQGPKHPYQMKRMIQDVIFTFAPFESESIYYTLRKMEKQGLVIKKAGRSGQRPQHYMYSITKQGGDEFGRLLNKSFLTIKRPFFNIDLSLYFMPYIKKEAAYKGIRTRRIILKRIEKNMKNLKDTFNDKKSFHLALILEHNLEVVKSEMKFLEKLTGIFKE